MRRTGGLRDTVIDFGDDGNGICHDQASVTFVILFKERYNLYNTKTLLNKIITTRNERCHSWERVCQEYLEMYQLINKNES
jgi:starch synthase